MIMIILTEAQKDLIQGKEFSKDQYFNVQQDNSGDWVISLEEMINLETTEYNWLYDCPMKVNDPIPFNLPGL